MAAALVALVSLAGAALALGATKTKTFSAGHFAKGVPNDGALSKSLKVKKKGKIKDVNVTVALSTNENDDYDFYVVGPGGQVVQLSTGNGLSGSGYGGTGDLDCADPADTVTFDDEAAENIDDFEGINKVFSGPYQPEGRDEVTGQFGLNSLDGKQLKGTWRLIVGDNEEIGAGTVQCFKVTAKYRKQK